MKNNFAEREAIADEVDAIAGFLNMLSDVFERDGNIKPELYRKCVDRAAVLALGTARRLHELLEV